MSERKILRPKISGNIVRDPDSRIPLAQDGEEKSIDPTTASGRFWLRRIMENDVIAVTPISNKQESSTSAKAKE